MKQVHVWSHKDGDHLVVMEVPWWKTPYEWLVNRICPCCGVTGFLSGKSEFFQERNFIVWNYLLGVTDKYEKELYKVSIESHCLAQQAIYGNHGDTCWEDDCPILGSQKGDEEEVSHML